MLPVYVVFLCRVTNTHVFIHTIICGPGFYGAESGEHCRFHGDYHSKVLESVVKANSPVLALFNWDTEGDYVMEAMVKYVFRSSCQS